MRKTTLSTMTLLAGSLLTSTALSTGYGADPERTLPIQISKDGLTRISVEGEKISDVFYYPEEALKVTLHPSGHVFVVRDDPKQKTAQLTLMGEQGFVQDLKLRFALKESAPVILHQSMGTCSESSEQNAGSQPEQTQALTTVLEPSIKDKDFTTEGKERDDQSP